MFAGSQHFAVAGGTFNNTTNNYVTAPALPPSHLRMIPMGDIDLQKELTVNKESWVLGCRRERTCVRRVYSAVINGRNSNVTVAVYQGDGAEEHWEQDAEVYMSVRHPNVIQIWAGASYGNIHATVFHGDLVPLKSFLARQSPIMMVYLYEYYRVNDYFKALRQRELGWAQCTMWIRTSTGRLCVDPVPPDTCTEFFLLPSSLVVGPMSSFESFIPQVATPSAPPDTELLAIEFMTLRQYYHICSLYLDHYRDDSISISATVNIGAVISWPSQHQYEEDAEIAFLAEINVYSLGWQGGKTQEHLKNGWSRYRAADVFNTTIMFFMRFSDGPEPWLTQANYVFSRLQIMSNLEDYVLIEDISFRITIGNTGEDPPPGYLFLCPEEDFQTSPYSFRWPNRAAYWSLDSEGIAILSTEKAARLGFPSLQRTTKVYGEFWDTSVYAGLRKFHGAKWFDSDSQDVARHLGYPLYEFSRDMNPPFAHKATADGANTDDKWANPQSSLHEDCGCDGLMEESCAEDDMGEVSVCAESHGHRAPEVPQEPSGRNSSGTAQETHTDLQIPHERATGGGFFYRISWGLQQALVTENENVDTDPISPFLI
ncbi:hypothetical protein C8F04DRAFT_1250350 [Mycena alexandri]|uniref:Protein kinase domain-containing protein n=1 Tax=Mycena alexandri TaxID=1745969 RepID=A0AAD6XC12_9AGAR|nr:hypothetical protein C8F04DRAFT_1250350 [Mycena alexandri]